MLILSQKPPPIHADGSFVGKRNVTAEAAGSSGVGTESKQYIKERLEVMLWLMTELSFLRVGKGFDGDVWCYSLE